MGQRNKNSDDGQGRFAVIHFDKDIVTIHACVAAANKIEECLKEVNPSVALVFADKIMVIGSFLGLLVKLIMKIREANGEIAIVTKNDMAQELLRVTGVNSIVSVYSTWEEFQDAELSLDTDTP